MAIPLTVVQLDRTKGVPTVEIIFGQAHVGNYRMFLWDSTGKNPGLLAHGNNIDDVLDTFSMPTDSPTLDESILSYEVIVQAAELKDGQIYSITITVRQDGSVVDGGLIQETGAFKDVKSVIGFRRFQVAG